MSVASTLTRLGGLASHGELRQFHSRRAIAQAVASGEVAKRARGRYSLPAVEATQTLAHQHSAVVGHLSAALDHGWKVKDVPALPVLLVPRGRFVKPETKAEADFHRACLTPAERAMRITNCLRTVIDCARALPFDAALTVADSALRSGKVTTRELRQAAATERGPGSAAVRRVAEHADGRAANPLESVLRAILLDIPGLHLRPQFEIAETGLYAIADLADPGPARGQGLGVLSGHSRYQSTAVDTA